MVLPYPMFTLGVLVSGIPTSFSALAGATERGRSSGSSYSAVWWDGSEDPVSRFKVPSATVSPAAAGGVIALGFCSQTSVPLYALPATLGAGEVGVPYTAALAAIQGTPPYTWTLAPGSDPLPPGLQIAGDGTIA
jgi:hypothetical protein